MIESGQAVAWEYQANGVNFSRFGVILGDIPKGSSALAFLTEKGITFDPDKVKNSDTSTYHRYLISVGEGDDKQFFTPLISIVDKANVNLANLGKLKAAQQKAKLDAENLQIEINKAKAVLREEAKKEEDGKIAAIADNFIKACTINGVKLFKVLAYIDGHYAEKTDPDAPKAPLVTGLITHKGETKSLTEWSKVSGISYGTLLARLKSGWPVEEALTTQVRTRK